jgi:endonuclease/exonuclease/phosphatase family metal-dependent hydrolase
VGDIVRGFQRTAVSLVFALLALAAPCSLPAGSIRVTTWNLQWFPHGSSKEAPVAEQERRITEAAEVLRPLKADIILLQEVQDYEACARLAEAIAPQSYQVAICSAFKDPFTRGLGKQQVAIMAKEPAQAAWSENWKSMEGVDPPRGFAFAWFKIDGSDIGIYSLHLKSNLIMRGDRVVERQKNIRKREVAVDQLLNHIRDMIAPSMPMLKSFVIGGDFNTNPDQPDFAEEKTLSKLTDAGFTNPMEGMPLVQRVTHPGKGRYPDATFDYLFGSNVSSAKLRISPTRVSDHYPVTWDFTLPTTYADAPRASNPAPDLDQSPDPGRAPPPKTKTTPDTKKLAPTTSPTPQFVTITRPVKVKIPYGETILPRGLKLTVISRDARTVTVQYLDGKQTIPIGSTDLQ